MKQKKADREFTHKLEKFLRFLWNPRFIQIYPILWILGSVGCRQSQIKQKLKLSLSENDVLNIEKQSTYVLHCHLVIFGLILAIFLRSQSYKFDVIADAGAP